MTIQFGFFHRPQMNQSRKRRASQRDSINPVKASRRWCWALLGHSGTLKDHRDSGSDRPHVHLSHTHTHNCDGVTGSWVKSSQCGTSQGELYKPCKVFIQMMLSLSGGQQEGWQTVSKTESMLHQGCQSSAFRRNSAFFFFSTFFKKFFLFFLKIAKKTKKFSLLTLPLSSIRIASVNSQWRLGLPVCAFFHFRSKFESAASPLSGRSHTACWRIVWAASTRGKGGWWFSGGMEDGLEVIARVLPFELQHMHPFHPHHTHTHSLSLSHTHTHTDIQGCQLPRFQCCGQFACYTCAKDITVTKKSTWFYILTQRLNNPSAPLHPSPSHWVSRGQLQKARLTLS